MREFSVCVHAADKCRPGSVHGRFVGLAIQQALIDSPRQRVGVEAGPTGLLERIALGIQEACAPESVGLLAFEYCCGHFFELLFEAFAGRVVRGQELQCSNEAAHHPPVSTTPEDLAAICLASVEVFAVAVIEPFLRIVKVVRGAPPVGDRKIAITFVSCGGVKPDPRGWGHEERVAPGPQIADAFLCEVQRRKPNWVGQDVVKLCAHRGDHPWIAVLEIEFHVGLADDVVIRMILASPQFPLVIFTHLDHGIAILGIAGDPRQRHHACIAGPLGPVPGAMAAGVGQLPVSNTFHHVQDGPGFGGVRCTGFFMGADGE